MHDYQFFIYTKFLVVVLDIVDQMDRQQGGHCF